MWQKEKLLVLSNIFFCHYVFKKPSAAEASESVYMRERVKKNMQGNNCNHDNIFLVLSWINCGILSHCTKMLAYTRDWHRVLVLGSQWNFLAFNYKLFCIKCSWYEIQIKIFNQEFSLQLHFMWLSYH